MNSKVSTILYKPKGISPLGFFRALFGLILFAESVGAIAIGWVDEVFIQSQFTFPFFELFGLANLLHGQVMYVLYGLMSLFGLGIMLGYRYKMSMLFFALLWTGAFLVQKEQNHNHFYLILQLSWLMVFLPAHRVFSLDVRRKPRLATDSCPQWCFIAIIGLFSCLYFHATLSKFYPDWLYAIPVKLWFRAKGHYPIIGFLLRSDWFPWFVSYAGILFDALIIPALLWRKTRKLGFIIDVIFHLANAVIFQIGALPFLMIAFTVLFCSSEQIDRIIGQSKRNNPKEQKEPPQKIIFILLAFFLGFNVFFPLRHHLIQGNILITEEGHRCSWRLMLRSRGGRIKIWTEEPNGEKKILDLNNYLTSDQVFKIAARPDLFYDFIQILKRTDSSLFDKSIHAEAYIKINGHRTYLPYKKETDFSTVKWNYFGHNSWISLTENNM